MKLVATLTMLFAAALLLADVAWAGPGKGRGKRLPPGVKQKLLEKYDTNGDGKLDEDEREAMRADLKQKALDKFDANGNGVLDEDEKKEMRKARKERRKERRQNRKERRQNESGTSDD